MYRLTGVMVTMSLINAIGGCSPNEPDPFYSGNCVVLSENDNKIIVKDWRGFGEAQPGRGYIARNAEASSYFPKLDRFPESTVVSWVFEDDQDAQGHSQTIDLRGIVPQNTEGHTEFVFGADGVWTVKFVPTVE